MDRWSSEQLTRMEKGGNAKAREFFESKLGAATYKSMTIPEKVPKPRETFPFGYILPFLLFAIEIWLTRTVRL
jgi:hypothetical protein